MRPPAPHLSTDDDGFRYDNQTQSSRRLPDVVVFSEAGGSALIPKKSKSGFMVGEHQTYSADPSYAGTYPAPLVV